MVERATNAAFSASEAVSHQSHSVRRKPNRWPPPVQYAVHHRGQECHHDAASVCDQEVWVVLGPGKQSPPRGSLGDSLLVEIANHSLALQAGLLLSVKNTASISLTAVVLPIISQLLLKIGMPPTIKDWWIVRVSAVISVAAALAMGLAPTVALFVSAMVFGESSGGLQAALRSVVTELVDQSHVALVMTVLSMSLTVSEMVAGPLMAETFKLGMELGGVLIGMPYLVSAALLSVGAVLLIWASMPRQAKITLEV